MEQNLSKYNEYPRKRKTAAGTVFDGVPLKNQNLEL
jgi:hypothetical protein